MKKIFLSLGFAAVLLGLFVIMPGNTDAYRGDPTVKGPYFSEERHTAMEKAFETKDYNSWKNLMQGRGRVTSVINKDNFSKFAQAHELAEQGKVQEANKIRLELGLGNGQGMGRNQNWNR